MALTDETELMGSLFEAGVNIRHGKYHKKKKKDWRSLFVSKGL